MSVKTMKTVMMSRLLRGLLLFRAYKNSRGVGHNHRNLKKREMNNQNPLFSRYPGCAKLKPATASLIS